MKKITLVLLTVLASGSLAFGQVTAITKAPFHNTTTQVRAPNGLATSAYMRAASLVLATELTNIASGTSITSFGFTLSTNNGIVTTVPVTGNFTVYLENTPNTTFSKGTSWPTILTGMTSVYASVMTIPIATTTQSVMVTLSTPFVYTGGGLYVAYDWACAGPYSGAANPATYYAEGLALNPGCVSAAAAALPAPTTLGGTTFRPTFLFGYANPYTNDIEVVGIEAPGKINADFNTPHDVKALIRNSSSIAQNNISVNFNVTGANPSVNNLVVPTLAAGASTLVSFSHNPLLLGANTLSVSVPGDQNNVNNATTYAQNVTCDTWAQNPAAGNYTTAIGLTAAGIIALPYLNPVASSLVGMRGAISNDAASLGNQVFGVLLSSTGVLIAQTNAILLNNSHLGTLVNFTFPTPQNLSPNTTYHLGFAQPGINYLPAGTLPASYMPTTYYIITGVAGGALNPVQINSYFGIEGVFAPLAPAPVSQTINCGSSATLATLGAGTFSWNTGALTPSISVTPVVSTNYSVANTSKACPTWSVHSISVTPFSLSISSNTTVVCATDLVNLTASGATSYTWTSPTNTVFVPVISENPIASTTYSVKGSNPNGCESTNSQFITVNPLPTINLASSISTICLGGTVFINATGNSTAYVWSHGPTTASTVEAPTSGTEYTVQGTNIFGCSASKTLSVTVNSFTPGITSPTSICQGTQIMLTATGGVNNSYSWSGFNFPSMTVSPSVTTIYSVTAKGLNGCSGSTVTTVTVESNPTVTAVAQRTTMCKGETNTLTATGVGATSYSWSTNSTNSVSIITPTIITTLQYSVTVTNSAGCTHSTQVSLKVNICSGINEQEQAGSGISVYPNPGTGLINIQVNAFGQNSSLIVYNTLGKVVKQQEIVSETTVLDIQNEANGIYFIHFIGSDGDSHVARIVKQ